MWTIDGRCRRKEERLQILKALQIGVPDWAAYTQAHDAALTHGLDQACLRQLLYVVRDRGRADGLVLD